MPDLAGEFTPFRPRNSRLVAWTFAGLIVAGVIALLWMGISGYLRGWQLVDNVSTVAFFGIGVWVVVRLAMIRAVPSAAGLSVRNFLHTETVTWAEIVGVSLMRGKPWVELDLADGETLAVMAIQGADGERGVAQARRLAALVAAHEGRGHD